MVTSVTQACREVKNSRKFGKLLEVKLYVIINVHVHVHV